MIRNKNQFLLYSEIYHIDIRQQANFRQPSVNVTKYQKRMYYLGVKVFNMLPSYIKSESDNPKKFKVVLRKFLYENSIYSMDEYFELQKVKYLHMIRIDIRKIGHTCSFSLSTYLYHLSVCMSTCNY
jgi:hypothetical protein